MYAYVQIADLETLKQSSRLVHYCATPLLFDPTFRQQIQADQQGKPEGKVRKCGEGSVHISLICVIKAVSWLSMQGPFSGGSLKN